MNKKKKFQKAYHGFFNIYILVVTAFISVLFFICCKPNTTSQTLLNQKYASFTQIIQAQDSGYITKQKGLKFLLALKLTDTLNSFWNQAKYNDTIGKFYKNDNTDNYFICSIDLSKKYNFETHLVLEVDSNGKVLKKERFFHGNYPCCWNNYYEGFHKYGTFFGINTCGTGSGYCASYLYLFKELIPQKSQNSIPESYWSSFGITQNLTSQKELNNNQLIMHYKLEKGELDDNSDFIINETKTFDVRFYYKNKKWITTEKNKLEGLEIEL